MAKDAWRGVRKKALVIAGSDYKYLPSLKFCKNDGLQMIQTLSEIGFEVVNDEKLIGAVKYDDMKNAITTFFGDDEILSRDTLFFYFSGHGITDETGDGYFTVYETVPDRVYELGMAIPFSYITDKLYQVTNSRKVISVLDCCYAGLARVGDKSSPDKEAHDATNGGQSINKKFKEGEGKYILCACLGTQEAQSTLKEDYSVFTYYILEGLKGKNKSYLDSDGNITPVNLGAFVYDSFTNLPVKQRPRQKPIIQVSASGNVILASYPRPNLESEYQTFPLRIFNKIIQYGSNQQKLSALQTLTIALLSEKSKKTIGSFVTNAKNITIKDARKSKLNYSSSGYKLADHSENDTDAIDVYYALSLAYDLYKNIFGRDSIDNKGKSLSALIHYPQNNTFFDGVNFIYGEGDGQITRKFTQAIDLSGRLFTYAVNQYDCNLRVEGEPGVIGIHLADVFGSLLKQYEMNQQSDEANWLVGEGIYTDKIKGKALRSLKAPGTAYDDPVLGKDLQPEHMKDYVRTDTDNGGVHINCGIPNKCFYLIATQLGGYAWQKAGKIWYKSMNEDLTSNATLQDLANITIKVAGRIFGSKGKEERIVRNGWEAVGIRT